MSQQELQLVHARYVQMDMPVFNAFWLRDVNPVSRNIKTRRISAPNSSMRQVHEGLIYYIRNRVRLEMPNATAGRLGDSALNNVLRHRKNNPKRRGFNRYIVLLDISSAYQAVDIDKLVNALIVTNPALKGREQEIKDLIGPFCFDPVVGGLVTGGPASPDFFNLYCEVLIDRELRELCEQYGITYSRYIDDLTFSSVDPIGLKKRRKLREVLTKAGFRISDSKARVYDLRKNPVEINGVGVCLNGRIYLPRHSLNHIRGLIHTAIHKGGIPSSKVHGKMGLLKAMTKPEKANATELQVFRLYEEFCRIDRARRAQENSKTKRRRK